MITYRWATRGSERICRCRWLCGWLLPHIILWSTHLKMNQYSIGFFRKINQHTPPPPNAPPMGIWFGHVVPGVFILPLPIPIFCWFFPSPGVHWWSFLKKRETDNFSNKNADWQERFTRFLIDPSYRDFPIIDWVMNLNHLIEVVCLSLLECFDWCWIKALRLDSSLMMLKSVEEYHRKSCLKNVGQKQN